ncbi:4Fe-4S binding protein [Clostridia bacterium]|nr:4Fe-4S binding protein [Clostridia bacterium]
MKTICITGASGGTGKSLVAAVLGKILDDALMADVSFSHMGVRAFAGGEPFREMEHSKTLMAKRFESSCNKTGQCIAVCPKGAIRLEYIDPCLCDGCGKCIQACPTEALYMTSNPAGRWFYADTDAGLLVDTDLKGAQVFDEAFARQVYQEALKLAVARQAKYLVVDLAAGFDDTNLDIMEDASLSLLVVEPTKKDLEALKRNLPLLQGKGIPVCLCINKHDLNKDYTMHILDFAIAEGLKTVGKLSYADDLGLMLEASKTEKQSFFGLIPNELKAEFVKMMVSLRFLTEEGE